VGVPWFEKADQYLQPARAESRDVLDSVKVLVIRSGDYIDSVCSIVRKNRCLEIDRGIAGEEAFRLRDNEKILAPAASADSPSGSRSDRPTTQREGRICRHRDQDQRGNNADKQTLPGTHTSAVSYGLHDQELQGRLNLLYPTAHRVKAALISAIE